MVKHPSRSRWRVGSFGVVSFLLWLSILPEADGGSGDMRKSQRVTARYTDIERKLKEEDTPTKM